MELISRFVTELLQIADMSLFCESRTRERREASTGGESDDPSLPQVRYPPAPKTKTKTGWESEDPTLHEVRDPPAPPPEDQGGP